MQPVELTVVDTTSHALELFPVEHIGAQLERVPLVSDPETGMTVLKTVYRADCTFLFIADKAFDIHVVGDETDPHAPTRD